MQVRRRVMNTVSSWGLKTFSRDALDKIHTASLDVLESTGVRVDTEEALGILEKGGCHVNKKTAVVKFPENLVMQALSYCPSQILLAGRNRANDFKMGGTKVGFTTFGTGVQTVDLETGELRDSTKEDVARIALLTDALPNMDFAMGMSVANDIPEAVADLHQIYAMVSNTIKPIVYATWGPEKQLIQRGAGYDEIHWAEGIYYERNSAFFDAVFQAACSALSASPTMIFVSLVLACLISASSRPSVPCRNSASWSASSSAAIRLRRRARASLAGGASGYWTRKP